MMIIQPLNGSPFMLKIASLVAQQPIAPNRSRARNLKPYLLALIPTQ